MSENNTRKDVEKLMKEAIKKNETELESALIKPISEDYKFSTNGIYFLLGKMGSGKSYFVWKHILTTEKLFDKPLYSLIVFSSTSGNLDKTSEAFSKLVNTPVKYVPESELMSFLTKHLKKKTKYYAICKHIISDFKESNDEMNRLIKKYSLEELNDRIRYVEMKLMKYRARQYPFNTLLVLDDFAASPLLTKKDSPLVRMLTKTRHYNLTAIIVAQTIKFVPLNLKRMATDVILYSKFSDEDFLTVLTQTPNNLNKKQALEKYRKLTGNHDRMILNITADNVDFINEDCF